MKCDKCKKEIDRPAKVVKKSKFEKDDDGKSILRFEVMIICAECVHPSTAAKPNIHVWKRE